MPFSSKGGGPKSSGSPDAALSLFVIFLFLVGPGVVYNSQPAGHVEKKKGRPEIGDLSKH